VEREHLKLSQSFDEKLHKETVKLTKVIQDVKEGSERDSVGMKRNMQTLSKELNDKHGSHIKRTKAMIDEVSENLQIRAETLGNQIVMQRGAIDKQVSEVKNSIKSVHKELKLNTQTWQKKELVNNENFELLNNEVNALKIKILNCPAVESSATALPPTDNSTDQSHSSESADNIDMHRNECVNMNPEVTTGCYK
jgi:hypothetical protein